MFSFSIFRLFGIIHNVDREKTSLKNKNKSYFCRSSRDKTEWVSKGFKQICILHTCFLKSDERRSTYRAITAFKSVGVSSDAPTFCFPQGSTPERKQNERFKQKRILDS